MILITSTIIFINLSYNKQPYGNDKDSIIQVIKTIDGYESGTIKILEIEDVGDNRVVGFLYNNSPAYIQFHKNPQGNYQWKHAEKRAGDFFSLFFINLLNSNEIKVMIVTNQENTIAKLNLIVNNESIEKEVSVKQNSVSWIDLPQSEDNSYSFEYVYFDQDGNFVEVQ
jgi:hypothetical protein